MYVRMYVLCVVCVYESLWLIQCCIYVCMQCVWPMCKMLYV